MIRNGPLKISKSSKKAENGPFDKNLFPITVSGYFIPKRSVSTAFLALYMQNNVKRKKNVKVENIMHQLTIRMLHGVTVYSFEFAPSYFGPMEI